MRGADTLVAWLGDVLAYGGVRYDPSLVAPFQLPGSTGKLIALSRIPFFYGTTGFKFDLVFCVLPKPSLRHIKWHNNLLCAI